jgi:hypothetical protein
MRKALVFATLVAIPIGFAETAQAEYCYDLVGTTTCTKQPDSQLEAEAQEYKEWIEEQNQIVPTLPEVGSEVISVVPGPLLEGTSSEDTIVETHEPLVIVEIGTPPTIPVTTTVTNVPIAGSINGPAVATEPARRVYCKVNITI